MEEPSYHKTKGKSMKKYLVTFNGEGFHVYRESNGQVQIHGELLWGLEVSKQVRGGLLVIHSTKESFTANLILRPDCSPEFVK